MKNHPGLMVVLLGGIMRNRVVMMDGHRMIHRGTVPQRWIKNASGALASLKIQTLMIGRYRLLTCLLFQI